MRNKPLFNGTFVGQVATHSAKVKTGKKRRVETEYEIMFIPIWETRQITDWVWNGKEWVLPSNISSLTRVAFVCFLKA